MRKRLFLFFGICTATILFAQGLAERLKDQQETWKAQLERGDAVSVRQNTEALLAKEALSVNPSDYNDMHALVALRGMAAKACVSLGAWEDALMHLQKACTTALESLHASEGVLLQRRQENEERLKDSREALAKQEPRLKEFDSQPGLTQEQIKVRQQLRLYVDEQRAAIRHSERALKDIDTILNRLKQDEQEYAKASKDWEGWLAKERSEIGSQGTVTRYVAAKVEQVKADDARPKSDRLAYARRLQKLDPSNRDVRRLINALLGKEEEPEPEAPAPKAPLKSKGKKRSMRT